MVESFWASLFVSRVIDGDGIFGIWFVELSGIILGLVYRILTLRLLLAPKDA